jgi:hypothetical protein
MRRLLILSPAALLLAACVHTAAVNPDPNHTHADFAVWLDGDRVDFSGDEFMSGLSDVEKEAEHPHVHLHEYLHLHDGNGNVVHRHKPGLTLTEFFTSIRIGFTDHCYTSGVPMEDGEFCSDNPWRLFVNGEERMPFSLDYAFTDLDRILITTASDPAEVQKELATMTDESCLYSKTCPERGEPPPESCISDPAIPCKE